MLNHPAILERVIDPARGNFTSSVADAVLKFAFPPDDLLRYKELSAKAQEGTLTAEERTILEDYLDVNDLLMFLKAKARASLASQTPAA
jgi:hypothetical protein